jgi:CubicO group peptidase (beta-lactamase class C family)
LPLVHDPGKAWTYGLSSDVAGRLIEVVSGEPLDRYLRRCVFEPLGMRDTHFHVPAAERRRLVLQRVRDGDQMVLAPWAQDPMPVFPSGGGGLHCTVRDYGRFVQMLLDGGSPIVSRDSIDSMTSNQIGDLLAMGLRYGLSIGLATQDARGRIPLPVGGFGWHGITGTWFWTVPSRDAAVLFFCSMFDRQMHLPLFARIVGMVENALAEVPR